MGQMEAEESEIQGGHSKNDKIGHCCHRQQKGTGKCIQRITQFCYVITSELQASETHFELLTLKTMR